MSETPEAPETPEIERRRRRNIHERNEWAALKFGLDPIRRGGLIGKGRGGGGGAAAAAAGRADGGGELVGAGKAVVGAGVDGGAAEVGEEAPPVSFDDLVRRWPGRAAQIDDLVGLIGEATDGVPVPPVLVTGPPCCGKTAVVRAVLDHQGCPYVYVNCAEVTSKTVLLEAVMEQMAGTREEIWEANRVDKRYRNADEETAFVEVVADGIPEGEPDEEAKEPGEEETEQLVQRKKGRSCLRTSSWNVFFRQLAALLARRSGAAHRSHLKAVADAKRALAVRSAAARSRASLVHEHAGDAGRARGGGGGGVGVDAGDDAVGDDAAGDATGSGDAGEAAGSASDAAGEADDAGDVAGEADAAGDDAGDATTTTTPTPLEAFPRKLFVVLDNADMLLGEGAAGVGVGVGEGGWRGPDLLVHVARLPNMVASFTGFAGDAAAAAAAAVGKASEATAMPVPLVCPVLISHNAFFASEIMGAGSGVLGSGRSLVARACPVQLWFPSYTQKELPDVLTATAESFGSDLDLDLDLKKSGSSSSASSGSRENSENKTPSSNTPLGTPGRRVSCGPASSSSKEGRKAFHKMARMMLQGLRNESSDVWELGAEAARIWPFYRKMVEDGCEERELLAGLKPLMAETTRRLHGINTGIEQVRSPRVGVGGAARAPPSSASSAAAAAAPASSAELAWRSRAPWSANANCNSNSNGKARAEKERRDKKMRQLCLSTAGKHVLVSAYLASHNSRDTDRDLFTSKGSRRSKRLRRTGAQVGNAANLEEAGVVDLPEGKDFQLERLLSIMSSLVAVTTTNTEAANRMGSSELFMQVRSLVRLNLMRESSARRKSFELDSPSYRCNISKELAESVAEDIGITLSQYLVSAR